MPVGRPIPFALIALFGLTGCAAHGLSFVQDDRVDIRRPGSNDTVELPLELAWTVEDFDGQFAVFFDRSPMRPGETLLSLVPEDDTCRLESSCPDEQWLATRSIYVTGDTSLVVDVLPDRRESRRTSNDRHDVTIVLLDADGGRVGESAFVQEFIVERQD